MKPSRLVGSGEVGVRPVATLGVPKSPEYEGQYAVAEESEDYRFVIELLDDFVVIIDDLGGQELKEFMLFHAYNRRRLGDDGLSIRKAAREFVDAIRRSKNLI